MPYNGRRKKWCRVCGRHVDECGPLSQRAKCADCGEGNALTEQRQLKAHDGPYFDHWRKRCLAAFGVVLDTDE